MAVLAAPPETRSALLSGAARGGLFNLAGAAVAGAAGFGVTWLIVRGLAEPARAGAFLTALAGFTLAAGVARLGTQTSLVYWPARLRALGARQDLLRCLHCGLAPVAAASLAAAAALAMVAGRIPPAVGGPLRMLALFLPLAVLTEAALAATRGYRAMRPTVLLDRLLRPALQLAALAALVAAGVGASAGAGAAFAAAWGAPYLPVAVLAGYALVRVHRADPSPTGSAGAGPGAMLAGAGSAGAGPGVSRRRLPSSLRSSVQTPAPGAMLAGAGSAGAGPGVSRRRLPSSLRSSVQTPAPGAFSARAYWAFTAPRAVASVAQLALQRLDVLLVAALGGLPAAAGYAVAGRYVVLGQFASGALANAVQPRLAERLAVGDEPGARALYQQATAWLVLATWPLHLLVAANAPTYLALFGPRYRAMWPVVVILAAAMLVATGCGMVDMVLAMAGRTRWNLYNVVAALSTMVIVDAVLVPRFGATGAAAGLAAAVLVNNLVPLAQLYRTLRLHPLGTATRCAAALAVACFGVPPLAALSAGAGPTALASVGAGGLIAYGTGAYLLRRPLYLHLLKGSHR